MVERGLGTTLRRVGGAPRPPRFSGGLSIRSAFRTDPVPGGRAHLLTGAGPVGPADSSGSRAPAPVLLP